MTYRYVQCMKNLQRYVNFRNSSYFHYFLDAQQNLSSGEKTKILTVAFIEIDDCPLPITPAKRYLLARRGMPFSGLNLPFSSVYAPIPVVFTTNYF